MARSVRALFLALGYCLVFPLIAAASGGGIKGYVEVDPTGGAMTGFARSVAEIADLDGDGIKELAVGAPLDDHNSGNPDANRGAVWILFMAADGSIKGSPVAQKLVLPTPQDGEQFGNALAWLGDLDPGPGVSHALAVGAPGVGTELLGVVRVLFLSFASGAVSVTSFQDVNVPHARCLPSSLAALGDLDGDGIGDLAVGNGCEGGSNRGAVFIVPLNSNGTQKSITQIGPSGIVPALDGTDEFGSSLAWLGAVGSSPRTLAVGAHQDEVSGNNTGVVYLLSLNADGTLSSYQKIGNGGAGLPGGTLIDDGQFGSALAALGDLDGDTVPDLAVGHPATGHGSPPVTGSAVVLFLNADGTVKDFQRIIADSDAQPTGGDGCLPCILAPQDYFGVAMASVADRNGDSVRDLAVGVIGTWQPNRLIQLFLADGPVQHPVTCEQVCGDELITGAEGCDDGNTDGGDGCSAACEVEPGYSCGGCFHGPSTCIPSCGSAVCGNSLVEAVCGEQCDDGNLISGDGCSDTCECEGTCGDGVVNPNPQCGEECDLGAENCLPGQCCAPPSCSDECQVTGACTGTQGCCESANDCPSGQGCCGDGALDPGEECDDGNLADLDCCSRFCKVEPAGAAGECDDGVTPCTENSDCPGAGLCHLACQPQVCGTYGPHMISGHVKRFTLTDSDCNGVATKWTSVGEFDLAPGQSVDPDTEQVQLILSDGGVALYDVLTVPPLFVEKGLPTCTKRWSFVDREADIASAIGWKTGKFTQRRGAGGVCSNEISYVLRSGTNAAVTAPAGSRIRQSLRIGNDCVTALLECKATTCPNSTARRSYRCSSIN